MAIRRDRTATSRSIAIGLVVVIAIAAIGVGLYYAYSAPRAPPPKRSLSIYSPLHEFEISRIAKAFEEETGIEARFLRLSAGEMQARIEAEAANPKGDVFFGGPAIFHMNLAAKGPLTPHESTTGRELDSLFRDPKNHWYGFYVGGIAFIVNTDLLKKFNLPEPKSWADLTKPVYKGHIVLGNPATSGTALTYLATILFVFGEEKGWEYVAALHKNVDHYERAGAAPAQLVGAGQFPIGVSFAHDILKIVQGGFRVKLIYPAEGTGWEIGAVSIIKNGPNPESAKIFVDWMLGRKAGQLHTDLSLRLSTRKDVANPPGAVPLEQIKLVNFDFKWVSDNSKRLVEKWRSITGA